MNQFQFELVSPEKLEVSKPVTMVTIPGGEGDYGVLVGHAPMITNVRPGVINIYADNDTVISERIFVCGGFAEVSADRTTILVEQAMPVSELNRAQVEVLIDKFKNDLLAATTDEERANIELQLVIAQAKLQAIVT